MTGCIPAWVVVRVEAWLVATLICAGFSDRLAVGAEPPDAVAVESPLEAPLRPEAPASPPKEAGEIGESTDTVERTLQDSVAWRPGLFGNKAGETIREGWTNSIGWLDRKTGIRLSFDYNSLLQYAPASPAIDLGSAGEFRATARWRPWWGRGDNPGFIDFQVRQRHRYSEIPPSDLGKLIGSLWPTTRGFNDSGWDVSHAYYEQYLFQQRFGFRLGRSRMDNVFDVHALRNQRLYFLNTAFSGNPAVADPAFGLLGIVMFRPVDNLKINLGITDANSRQLPYRGASGVGLEDYYVSAQVGWRPKLTAAGDTLLQGMYWDRGESSQGPAGNGFSLLAQHRWPDRATAFLRYSHSFAAAVASQFVATGAGWTPFPTRSGDLAGAAFAWGRPMTAGLRDQYAVELFYRLRLTASLELTPDLQFIIDPSLNPQSDLITVFGVRARLSF